MKKSLSLSTEATFRNTGLSKAKNRKNTDVFLRLLNIDSDRSRFHPLSRDFSSRSTPIRDSPFFPLPIDLHFACFRQTSKAISFLICRVPAIFSLCVLRPLDSAFFPSESMIPDSDRIFYACVARGTTILADFSPGESDLEALALKCVESTPPFHLLYSYTTGKRIYCFLIEDPFVFFAIIDQGLGKSRGFRFLDRLKTSFASVLKRHSIKIMDHLNSLCFQEEFGPVIRSSMHLSGEGDDQVKDPDPSKGENAGAIRAPLLEKQISNGEEIGDVSASNVSDTTSDANEIRARSLLPQKNGGSSVIDGGWGQARRIWRKQVRIVLLIDLVVCCALFCVWLTICKGLRCVDG